MRLVPGLVGPVSVYCDWVGYSSCATLDIPVWQHAFNCLSSSTVSIWPSCIYGTLNYQNQNQTIPTSGIEALAGNRKLTVVNSFQATRRSHRARTNVSVALLRRALLHANFPLPASASTPEVRIGVEVLAANGKLTQARHFEATRHSRVFDS